MNTFSIATTAALATTVTAQQVGTYQAEDHPSLSVSTCTTSGGCQTSEQSIVLDSNWRWVHTTEPNQYTNCYEGSTWDDTLCPDPESCAANCALDGADYEATYGIKASGSDLTLGFVTEGANGGNVGSRSYLLAPDGENYDMFKLLNQEFTFTVDVSNLPCGLNGALYFVEMSEDGDLGGGNSAGAAMGTGYCDAQCPHDIKFMDGEANILDWNSTSADSGYGRYGTCCNEMDIWEANSMSQAVTPHACSVDGQYRCEGTECGDNSAGERQDGVCDKDGCDFAPYRNGDTSFFGPGSDFKVDSSKPFTIVTQFITDDGTNSGELTEIRRKYVQDGNVIENSKVTFDGEEYDSVSDDFCAAQKSAFGDENTFGAKGGMKTMGAALERGMVLVMSLWDDHDVNMLWLDSDYPTDADPSTPGVSRGSCSTDSGKPEDVESQYPDASVTFSDIKSGDIDSTY